ncbi:MAG: TonB-dependent receptor, partial [Gammaproteobacteria bacterium]
MKTRRQNSRPFSARLNPVSGAVAMAIGSMAVIPVSQPLADEIYDEIFVTATRRATSVQDVPYNISAVSAGELQQLRGVSNISGLARWVPGMVSIDQGARASSPLIMRGISVGDLTFSEASGGNSNGNTVATYVGEVPVYIDLVTKDLARVEILRGPQGTLFGANSLAGAVRYIPNRPDFSEFEVDLHSKIYDTDESGDASYDLDGVVNVPITDRLALRGVLSYEDRAGFVDQKYLVRDPGFSVPEPDFSDPVDVSDNLRRKKDVNDVETWYARTSLAWDATDDISFLATYHYQDKDVGGRQINTQGGLELIQQDQGVAIPTGFYDNGLRFDEHNEQKNHILEFVATFDFGFAELTSATGYIDYEDDGQRDQTDLLLTFGATYADFPSFSAFTSEKASEETLTQELRLVSKGDGPVNWIGGFFYSDAERDFRSEEYTPCLYTTDPTCAGAAGVAEITDLPFSGADLTGTDIEYIQDEHQESEEWAIFGEIGYRISDAWQVTLGARYFEDEYELEQSVGTPLLNQILISDGDIDPNDPDQQIAYRPSKNDDDIDKLVFKINTSYDLTEDTMAYFTFSEGYRRGNTNGIQECDPPPTPDNNVCGSAEQLAYKPDETDNYEIGLRNELVNGSLIFNAAIFYIDWENIQVGDVSEEGGFPITLNGDKAKSQGAELEFTYQITDQLQFRGSYAYTDAQLRGDSPQLQEGTAQDGDRLPGTPKHQGALFLSFNQQVTNGMDLTLDYGMTAQSDVFTKLGDGGSCCRPDDGATAFVNPGPGEKLSGFDVHYAAVTLAGNQWAASLYADNLWNEKAVTGVRADRSLLLTAGGASDYALRRYFNYV